MEERRNPIRGLAGQGPDGIGALGSDFVAHMRDAAEAYCIGKAIEGVKRGFKDGYSVQSTDGRESGDMH